MKLSKAIHGSLSLSFLGRDNPELRRGIERGFLYLIIYKDKKRGSFQPYKKKSFCFVARNKSIYIFAPAFRAKRLVEGLKKR